MMHWETICKDQFSTTERLKVKDGWLVKYADVASTTMVFIPDLHHSWKLDA